MKINSVNPISIIHANNKNLSVNKQSIVHNMNVSFGKNNNDDTAIKNSVYLWHDLRDRNFTSTVRNNLYEDEFDPNYTNTEIGIPLLATIYNPSLYGKMYFHIDFWNTNKLKKDAIHRIIYHLNFDPFKEYFDKKKGCKRNYFVDAVHNKDSYLLKVLFQKCSDKGLKIDKKLYFSLLEIAKGKEIKDILDTYKPLVGNKTSNVSVEKDDDDDSSDEDFDISQSLVKKPKNSKMPFPNAPATLDDLGGMQDVKKIINEFIILPWSPGIRNKLKANNISMPNGFLMYGPPGCGKTYITNVIANQTGFPMHNVDLATVGSSYGYETARNLKKIFTELEKKYKKDGVPNILFLDEIDSIGASRKNGNTDWKKDDINTLIALINNVSEKGIILIGATNLIEDVDEAILRPGRFDKKIYVGLPDEKSRKDIFDKMIKKIPIAKALAQKTDILAELTKGKSNAEISAILNECCREAICHKRDKISLEDFKKTMSNIEAIKKENKKEIIGFSPVKKCNT